MNPLDLSICTSVVYEERNSVPGVKFVEKDQEVWSPVVRRSEKKKPVNKGDGSRSNPIRDEDDDADPRFRLSFAKDIRFMELDGSPGLIRIERERQTTAIGGCPSLSTAQSHQELELRLRN